MTASIPRKGKHMSAPTLGRHIAPTAIASATNLTKVFGGRDNQVVAVNDVSVDFELGSFTAIMGPSGSGKSTLMHCLAGLDRPTSGRIMLGESEITSMPDRAITKVRREQVGFVFQAFNLLPTLTAEQNISLPLDLAGKRVDTDRIREIAESLGIADRLTHRPSEMSGGQQQRVAIARALVTNPDVIFADEPTGALDSRSGIQLLSYLRNSVRELGQTVVMVTHDPNAAAYADRALILSDGRIVEDIDEPDTDAVLAAMKRLGA
ncbi:MAG: peptide ABC transporter ATP-binding protein [Propionibacteriales bacterium]|nr:MAG: peptide ABC transporter ATP-binding protein [Propionibacteriales bacterium]